MKWRPPNIGHKQDWQEKFRNIRLGRKGVEEAEKVENSSMAVPFYDENLYILSVKNDMEAKVKGISFCTFLNGFLSHLMDGVDYSFRGLMCSPWWNV